MNNDKIKICIVGCGNCAASILMGLQYYKNVKETDEHIPGLMHNSINGYLPSNIKCILAYDIDARKVGLHLNKAIFELPNNTKIIYPESVFDSKDYPIVKMGKILDGFSPHLLDYDERYRIVPSKEREPTKEDEIRTLKESKVEILISYLPVGSQLATEFYVDCCLEAGVALINCIPVFVASDPEWANKFKEKGIPVLGDDVKSQLGATIIHRNLAQLFKDRGVKLDRTYQLNCAGNLDFMNMLNRERLKSKKISKTEAVQSILSIPLEEENIHIGPSDYVPWLQDNKICYLRMEGRIFGNIPINLELRLSVEDSPNSAGVVLDCIRIIKIGLDRHIGGHLLGPSAFYFKHPPVQYPDHIAKKMVEDFINEIRDK